MDIYKIIFVGSVNVGKSTIQTQLLKESHVFQDYASSTIGGVFSSKCENGSILYYWDTAGQERYNSITKHFFRDTSLAIIVFEMTNDEFDKTFERAKKYITEIEELCPSTKFILVGNKMDLCEDFKKKELYIKTFVSKYTLESNKIYDLVFVSAKEYLNIVVLNNIIKKIIKNKEIIQYKIKKLEIENNDEQKNSCYSYFSVC